MADRYVIRLKEHLDEERVTSLVNIMSFYTLRLSETGNDREYVVALFKSEKAAELERDLDMWEAAGFAEWRRLEK